MSLEAWHCWLAAAALTAILGLALMPVARALGWMDHPSGRKVHAAPTPLVGGVAIFITVFSLLFATYERFADVLPWPPLALLLAAGIVLVTGLIDDRWPLSARVRFIAQGVACLVMVYLGGVVLSDFGSLFWAGVLGLGYLAVPITVFAALGVINAFNMIDGLDGLSGSVFLIACLAMALLAAVAGQGGEVFFLLLLAGSVCGFLLLNARLPWNARARIFLGDSGSVLLGFLLAWMFIDLGNGSDRAFAPMTAVWIFGIPLLDTSRLMRNRWKQGRSAFEADQYHLHHAFLRAGFCVGQAWWGIVGLSALCAAIGIVLELLAVPEYVRFYGFIAFGLLYFALMKHAWRTGRFLGRAINTSMHTDA